MNMLQSIKFNPFGLIIVVVMLTPNILYVLIKKNQKKVIKHLPVLNALEQVGRYGSLLFMTFSMSYKEVSDNRYIVFIIVGAMLTVAYVWVWRAYFIRESKTLSYALATIPPLIFVFTGIILYNIPLIISSVIFGVSHIIITKSS